MESKFAGMLQESEQKLLMRFLDGECGYFEKRRAQQLCSRPEAAKFLEEMQAVASESRSAVQIPAMSPELWKRVFNRIEQEEKAEVFLGKRKSARAREGFFGLDRESWSWSDLRWKVFGPAAAFAMACAAFVIVFTQSAPSAYTGGDLARKDSGRIVPVSAVAARSAGLEEGAYAPPRIIEDRVPSAMDVRWMRSRGRVRTIQDADENSTIVLIKRRPSAQSPAAAFVSRQSPGMSRLIDQPIVPQENFSSR